MSHPLATSDALLIKEAIRSARNRSAASRDTQAPQLRIPGYQIIRQLARGGQGTVYQAIHAATERDVAIKVLPPPDQDSSGDPNRFIRELAALREINHPNIVPIQDAGFAGLSPFIVMSYIEGWRLDEFIAASPPDTADALRLFERICLAVHAAHLRGVIHRDLKPGNIIIDDAGEPHILDFGLAKLVGQHHQARSLTIAGEFLGSLPWASPEQVDGAPADVDARADVYGLGAILFHMLTGGLPYDASGSVREVLTRIATQPPIRPRSLRPDIDADAETIILRCLARKKEDRYQSASEVAAEARRRLENQPIEARRDSLIYVVRTHLGRHRVLATVSGALGSAALLSLVLAWVMFARANQAAVDAGHSEQQAQQSAREAMLSLADSRLTQAREMRLRREVGFRDASLKLLAQAAAVRGSTLELRNEALASLAQADLVVESQFASAPNAQFGRMAAMKGGVFVCGTQTGEFRVRTQIDDQTVEYPIDPPEAGDETGWVDLSPNGRYLVGAFQKRFSHDVRMFAWDVAARRRLWVQPLPGQIPTLRWAFNPDDETIAVAHPDRTVKVQGLAEGSVEQVVPVDLRVNDLLFLRIGTNVPALLLADDEEARLVRWNLATGASTELPLPSRPGVLAQSSNGRWLAVGCLDHRILLYRIDPSDTTWPASALNGTTLPHAILSGHLARLARLFFAMDGNLLVSSADDVTTRFWDVPRGVERFAPALNTHLIGVDADRIAIADAESRPVGLWRLQPAPICRTLPAPSGVPAFIDERWFAIGGGDGLSVWDARSGMQTTTLHERRVTGVCVRQHDLLAATLDGLLRWSIEHTPQGPLFVGPDLLREGKWLGMCVSPDNSTAFLSDQDRVWRVPLVHPESATVFAEHLGARPKSVSPDGKRVVVGNWAGSEVVVYSVADGSRLFSLPTRDSHFAIGAFAPPRADGGSVLIIATNERYHFLDAATYEERHAIPRHGWLVSLAVSPDGEMAMITRSGSVPALINLRTFAVLADLTLPEPNATLAQAAFDPTGTTLVMTTNIGQTFVCDLAAMREQLGQLGLDWP